MHANTCEEPVTSYSPNNIPAIQHTSNMSQSNKRGKKRTGPTTIVMNASQLSVRDFIKMNNEKISSTPKVTRSQTKLQQCDGKQK